MAEIAIRRCKLSSPAEAVGPITGAAPASACTLRCAGAEFDMGFTGNFGCAFARRRWSDRQRACISFRCGHVGRGDVACCAALHSRSNDGRRNSQLRLRRREKWPPTPRCWASAGPFLEGRPARRAELKSAADA